MTINHSYALFCLPSYKNGVIALNAYAAGLLRIVERNVVIMV